MSLLQIRLKNCLETLLETEPALTRRFRVNFIEDFKELRIWLEKADSLQLGEEEIAHIERLTSAFLAEAAHAGCSRLLPATRLH